MEWTVGTGLWLLGASTVVLGAAALLAAALRRRSAALRHMVWSVGVGSALALPLVAALLPMHWRVLPAVPSLPRITAVGAARAPLLTPAALEARARADPTSAPREKGAGSGANNVMSAPTAGAVPHAAWRWGEVLLLAWLGVAGVLLARFLVGVGMVAVLAIRSPEIQGADWNRALARAAERAGLRMPVRLLRTTRRPMPMTWGVRRPVILLPESADEWSAERRAVVLLHELAHIRRRDTVTLALGQLARSLYWFQPIMWLAVQRLRAEAERACDDLVLRAGARASSYAEHLLAMVRTGGCSPLPVTASSMVQRSGFEGRVLAILEPTADRRGARHRHTLAASTLLGMLVLGVAALAPAPASPPPRTTTSAAATRSARAGVEQKADIGELLAALRDSVTEVRLTAAEAVGEAAPGDPRAVAALVETLSTDTDATVRKTAAWGLGQLRSRDAVQPLAHVLTADADPEVQMVAAWALGQIEPARAPQALLDVAVRGATEVRQQAIWALRQIGDPAATRVFRAALKDPDATVRLEALYALAGSDGEDGAGRPGGAAGR